MKTKNIFIPALMVVAVVVTYYIRTKLPAKVYTLTANTKTIDNTVAVSAVIAGRDTLIQRIAAIGYIRAIKKVVLNVPVFGISGRLMLRMAIEWSRVPFSV